MNLILGILTDYYFLAFIIAWICSILIKTGLTAWKKKTSLDIAEGLKNGGMPSSHSTVVAAITTAVYNIQGLTGLFFVSLVFSLIIISDAFRLRRIVGIHGEEINLLLKKIKKKPIEVIYGHSFFQVIIGIILGIAVSQIVFLIMYW
ncbi:TPA: divergent PAP2 family protein [Candidatus Woesearchaeota archaeon]|nr:divergent PAP2 family protein [Candidatus Woesearchaeota archaeon]HIH31530.1 divergent PAP2 family protein [Candidatus Woesearchaeota archaeon]HIH54312.1 divergent PAP2 family protein [Candidatus Woesearchaeota archaeon]HIJ02498.1 divergent PAP2 family protein [Candidatus Woesearchaeota archaeon]HIJ13456.1 divergent PAP2 family protein [Candidatus Woesearchaeota archaeon]